MIHRLIDPYSEVNELDFFLDNKVIANSIIKIMNVNDERALHSHKIMYSQKDASHLREVTSFIEKD